jgi:hypothetical protein
LQHSVQSWYRQDYPQVEYVIVGGPQDDGLKLLPQNEYFHGTLLHVRNAPHYRASYMRNLGVLAATGEILCFVDADIALDPNWVSFCVAQLKRRFDIVVNSPLLSSKDMGGATGTLAIQRWLFERIRGYNENLDYAWGYEDTDLIVRSQKAGGRVSGYPPAMLRHITHEDSVRSRHFCDEHDPRAPKTFMQHLKVCQDDCEIHLFEANRVQRLRFPPDEITKIVK